MMARVVLAQPEAVGGEGLLDDLTQRRQLAGAMAARDPIELLQQMALHGERAHSTICTTD